MLVVKLGKNESLSLATHLWTLTERNKITTNRPKNYENLPQILLYHRR